MGGVDPGIGDCGGDFAGYRAGWFFEHWGEHEYWLVRADRYADVYSVWGVAAGAGRGEVVSQSTTGAAAVDANCAKSRSFDSAEVRSAQDDRFVLEQACFCNDRFVLGMNFRDMD